ncbi:MAG: C-GCAxxG-C-C family protein [Clostridia bacterium]|nr:C-GCAxxG-C-C family protein [Clostridia bacterium]
MEHDVLAGELFRKGYNCSQAVLLAFSDVTGLDQRTALAVSSSFGGGMGRLREVCGAVSGAFMVAGLLWGGYDPNHRDAKAEHYKLIQRLAARLKEENGSIICRELLGLPGASAPVPEERTADYYRRRPCEAYIRTAARIIDEEIKSRGTE